MKVTLLQTDMSWMEPETNMARAEAMMSDNPHSDIYILPEMWTTGFVTDTPQASSAIAGSCKALQWMTDMATRHNAAVCGSIATIGNDNRPVNRLYFVKPGGDVAYYDKRHLFRHGHEDVFYSPGNRRVVTEYRGMRFLLATCYDLRFPVWLRNRNDYDTILLVANWPDKRRQAWDILLRARAIENLCYVAACNRTGNDPACKYAGGSLIIGPQGNEMASCDDKPSAATAEISRERLEEARAKFNALDDRDNFVTDF